MYLLDAVEELLPGLGEKRAAASPGCMPGGIV
jgi:hypothetical protein